MSRTNSKGGVRRRYYARYLAHYTKKNYVIMTLGGLFLLGVILGTLMIRGAGEQTVSLIERMMGGLVERRREASLYQNFMSAAGSSMLFVLVIFVCGFCAIAQPAIVLAPLFRGLGFGFSAASLFARHGTSAAGFVGVLLLPGMVVSTVGILLCCRQSLRLSMSFFSAMRQGQGKNAEPYSLQNYCLSFCIASGICLLAAFVEAVLYVLFANSFLLG